MSNTSEPRELPDLVDALAADARRTALDVALEFERTAEAIRRLADDPNLDAMELPFSVLKVIETGMINASASRLAMRGAAIGKAYRSGAIPTEAPGRWRPVTKDRRENQMTEDIANLDAHPENVWQVGTNGQHTVYEFRFETSVKLQHFLLVDGYNIMADDGFMASLAREYGIPIVFRSQIGAHPDRDPDGQGGWRVRWPDTGAAAMEVPFRELASNGVVLR